MSSLTAANAIIMLAVTGIFPTPQRLQGFAADNIYEAGQVDTVETLRGVDGKLSGGFVYGNIEQNFSIQADSPSIAFFEQWDAVQKRTGDTFTASGTTNLISTGRVYNMTKGFLVNVSRLPSVGRIIGPRRWLIRWEDADGAPAA